MRKSLAIALALMMVLASVGITVANSYCRMAAVKSCKASCMSHCERGCCGKTLKVFKLDYESLVSGNSRLTIDAGPGLPSDYHPLMLPGRHVPVFIREQRDEGKRCPSRALLQSYLI